MKLIYDVNERPDSKKNLLFAFQQMIAIMAATLLVPIIMTADGLPSDPAAALFGAGLGTLFYIFATKGKSPVFLGSTFTFLSAYAASIGCGYGYWGVIIGVGFAGLVYVIFSFIIKSFGAGFVNKLMPNVIAGPIVTLIGLSLSGTATGWMQTNGGDTYSLVTIAIGLATFFAIVYSTVKGSQNMKLFPFIYGIGAGYVLSLAVTLIGTATGNEALCVLSFDGFKEAFGTISLSSFISVPGLYILKAMETQGQYAPIDGGALVTLALIYAPIAVVELAQHVGDHKNLGNIIGKDLITDPGLDKTLIGDGIGSFIGTLFGSCANTTYGESIGCVAITGNASTYTIQTAALGCMLLSFFTPFVVFINSIPKCVMGGACVALYGLIAVSGLQLLSKVDLGDNRNLYVASSILVCGIGGLSFNFGYNSVTNSPMITFTALAASLIVGLITRKITGAADEELSSDTFSGHVEGMKDVDMDK